MGHSHALYNPTAKPVQYLNFNVGAIKGHCDNFDLGDSRIGVSKDPIPVFMSARLDGSLLKPVPGFHGGKGTVKYRRLFDSDVFLTNWAYVDHLVIPTESVRKSGVKASQHRLKSWLTQFLSNA
jgi:hypothetical protein